MKHLTSIETKRLRLRQWKPTDHEPFAVLNADPRVMDCFPSLLTRKESDAIARRSEALIRTNGWGPWAVERLEDEQFIGMVGLHVPSSDLPFSPCTEVLWRLAFDSWGRGFATEAARGAVEFGFRELLLDEIVAFTALVNHRSRAVMERLGMVSSSTFEHPALPPGHRLRPHCLYRLRSA